MRAWIWGLEPIRALLDDMIDQKLLASAARQEGLDQSERGQRAIELAKDRALSEIFLRNAVDEEITEDSLRALYDEQIGSGEPGDEVRARHILLATEEEAQDVYQQLQDGSDFEELAKKLSLDPGSGAQGGELGYFTKERMVPEFSTVAFATKVGKVSEPFQSQFGWHVLKVEDKRKGVLPSFEELRQQIVRYQTFTVVQNTINDLRGEAEIDYFLPEPEGGMGIDFSDIEAMIKEAEEQEAAAQEDTMEEIEAPVADAEVEGVVEEATEVVEEAAEDVEEAVESAEEAVIEELPLGENAEDEMSGETSGEDGEEE